jgi:hypothetical protein
MAIYNRTVLSETVTERLERQSRLKPFLFGTLLALAAFSFLAWDLEHHWSPYSPHRAPSAIGRLLEYYWLVDLVFRLVSLIRRKWREAHKEC